MIPAWPLAALYLFTRLAYRIVYISIFDNHAFIRVDDRFPEHLRIVSVVILVRLKQFRLNKSAEQILGIVQLTIAILLTIIIV